MSLHVRSSLRVDAISNKVGIRELRQKLQVFLERAREEAHAYEMTDRRERAARRMSLGDRLSCPLACQS
jgi:hypothetical protein